MKPHIFSPVASSEPGLQVTQNQQSRLQLQEQPLPKVAAYLSLPHNPLSTAVQRENSYEKERRGILNQNSGAGGKGKGRPGEKAI